MNKLKPSNVFFGIFLILMIIPSTRSILQVNLQKILTKVIPVSTIDENEQKKISNYSLHLKGINTKNITISDNNDKVIFINYWATWCPPCIAEMPDLQKLYNDYQGKITFAFISNENQKKINSFLEKNKLTLPVYNQTSTAPIELNHSSIPTTFIIDKKGNLVIHKTGVANWNSKAFLSKLNTLIEE